MPRMPHGPLFCPAALSVALAFNMGVPAGAEVQLSGTQDNVMLQAKNASINEIVTGIQSTFNMRVALLGSTPRQFTGSYEGSLRHVLSRLLDGESYFISSASDGMKIVIVNAKGTAAAPVVGRGNGPQDIPGRAAAPNPAAKVIMAAAPTNNSVSIGPPVPNSIVKPPAPRRLVVPILLYPADTRSRQIPEVANQQQEETKGNPGLEGSASTDGRFVKHSLSTGPAVTDAGEADQWQAAVERKPGLPRVDD